MDAQQQTLTGHCPHGDHEGVDTVAERTWSTVRKPFRIWRYGPPAGSPEVALLVTTFEKPWHLQRVLHSIAVQDAANGLFEVVVTDDGSKDETHRVVRDFAASVPFAVTLTSHPHSAFQLARCRNEGVAASRAPYLLFLDGDCVLPPDHVARHLAHRRAGRAMCGYCIRLDKDTTARFDDHAITTGAYQHWTSRAQRSSLRKRDRKARFYQLIRHSQKPRLTGGNFGVWREDYERINGFDENFEGWGGEDDDLGRRLRQAGVQLHSILRWTHSYHLWHPPHATVPDRICRGMNHEYLVRKHRLTKCTHGLVHRHGQDVVVFQSGQAAWPEQAASLLRSCPLNLVNDATNVVPRQPEVELLFLPGSGTFTGRADCNVLVVLGKSRRISRLATQADLVISDLPCRRAHRNRWFRLADFRQALNSLAGS